MLVGAETESAPPDFLKPARSKILHFEPNLSHHKPSITTVQSWPLDSFVSRVVKSKYFIFASLGQWVFTDTQYLLIRWCTFSMRVWHHFVWVLLCVCNPMWAPTVVRVSGQVRVLCVYLYDWTLWRSADRDISFFFSASLVELHFASPIWKKHRHVTILGPRRHNLRSQSAKFEETFPRRDKHGPGTWKSAFGRSETPTFRRMLVKMLVAF